MIDVLYIFVEGEYDELFIKSIFSKFISQISKRFEIVKYAKMRNKNINNYIKSIKSMNGDKYIVDYIFLSDQDECEIKKDKIISKFKCLSSDKIYLAITEIESWIISGISNKVKKKLKVNLTVSDTSSIRKEEFKKLIPKNMTYLEFVMLILDDYDLENALNLNSSLKSFNDYFIKKKAS